MNQTEGSAIDYLTGRHNWTEKEDTHTQHTHTTDKISTTPRAFTTP